SFLELHRAENVHSLNVHIYRLLKLKKQLAKLKRKSPRHAPDLGLIFQRLLAVSFFNNLEEVKFYLTGRNAGHG
ncbi:hypothetical protein, partial [Janthinobacterium sp. CG3]|uniref:hypothetical protein n=1 Tax=Janthinobacterium sp. CG3 TaxID=1075768 RepID=UPI001E5B32FF